MGEIVWRKSSHSGQEGDCVEVAATGGHVLIRDSKAPDGGVIAVSPETWRDFLRSVKGG
ncbi:DUF397 domain-containing protein [Bailinhaonella thermotolerans]|uniref:DUF397 domain-containing protein n=1 Tax=Bailinhaonella thermotolerans TaxID=1070861 RepID=A0A3A4A2Z6_9ACTN|nr:DUF397 domain-containing protein [Bailinhaonella thermotolerans]RJL22805.1 DUF397 domain-containing protein [Bailinhaonella thermotolerans]